MDTSGKAQFERGRSYSRAEIHAALGGSRRAALATQGGKVVCLCLTRERNPRAPDEAVICGDRSVKLARDLSGSGAVVPVFVRVARGRWEYAGDRCVRAPVPEPAATLADGAPDDASLVLLLEEVPGVSEAARPAGAWPTAEDAPGEGTAMPAAGGSEG